MRIQRRLAFLATVAIAAGLLVGGTAEAESKGKIVAFIISSTNPYIGQWEKGAKAKADELGYEIKFIENNFNQAEEDSQVQQQLASGETVAGYIWWPFQNAAGVASLRALKQSGAPVVLSNQFPIKGTEDFWSAYAGANDFLSGQTAGKMLLDACAKSGAKCDKGFIIRFPAGYSAGDDRVAGFKDAIKDKLTVVDIIPSGGFMEDDGYKVAAQMIPAHKDGLTWIYTENDSMAAASTQALQENGLKPGKDVFVVGGTCHGDPTHVVNGDLVGTAIQSGYFEGWLAMQTLAKIVRDGGKVADGEKFLDANPDSPPSDDGPAYRLNYLPNPAIGNTQAAYDSARMWGKTIKELCTF